MRYSLYNPEPPLEWDEEERKAIHRDSWFSAMDEKLVDMGYKTTNQLGYSFEYDYKSGLEVDESYQNFIEWYLSE